MAVCAGSDLMHPIGALITGGVAGAVFVYLFTYLQNKTKIDDVLGVWPLHGVCGVWGGIAAGIFGQSALGGLGGVSITVQVLGTVIGIVVAVAGAAAVYGVLNLVTGLRLSEKDEFNGADLAIHKISSTSED